MLSKSYILAIHPNSIILKENIIIICKNWVITLRKCYVSSLEKLYEWADISPGLFMVSWNGSLSFSVIGSIFNGIVGNRFRSWRTNESDAIPKNTFLNLLH